MKINHLLAFSLLLGLVAAAPARTQSPLVFFDAGCVLGRKANQLASRRATTASMYRGRQYVVQRTPSARLPAHEAKLITTLEGELDRCRTAMLADSTGAVCPPEQHTVLRNALANLVRARLHWDVAVYEQEMDFYLFEQARRQQLAAPAIPAPAP